MNNEKIKEFFEHAKDFFTKEELALYIEYFNKEIYHGININLKKLSYSNISINEIESKYNLKRINIYDNKNQEKSHYYTYIDSNSNKPGKSIFFDTGLFYIQEPSQMNVILHLNIQKSDKILDICASPGGKAVQALMELEEDKGGFLWANEVDQKRAKILSSNIERMGFANCIVSSINIKKMGQNLCGLFDKIIVDAPCSGEGMFRKDPFAIEDWSIKKVKKCVEMQKEIMNKAYFLLKNNSYISYSTCTFEKEENEGIIQYLLNKYKDLEVIEEARIYPFLSKYNKKNINSNIQNLILGEGHYFCILKKH
ncbi:MAG: RsmB/NOP family class I SAM-dependent RNA methyltransferase [Eubacteriales bacterium]|nr:RsmB/NOP family class I SAM-dependent RNA methyltransferase [Eubacteriales bacterium]